MHIQDLTWEYQSKSDEELLRLATEPDQLTADARTVLAGELARRQIDGVERLKHFHEEEQQGRRAAKQPAHEIVSSLYDWHVSRFIEDVLRLYHSHFWFFVKLVAPAVVMGYIAILGTRSEAREIIRQLPPGFTLMSHRTEIIELWLVNISGYLASWLAFCISFGAISSGVRQVRDGFAPSVRDSIAAVRERMGPFFRLSLLLLFLLFVAEGVAGFLFTGVFRLVQQRHSHMNGFTFFIVSYTFGSLALLVFSRFGLAIPALVLDNYRVGQSIFRSDELTEGKWLILAALLGKSLVLGYVVGMCPFWLTRWIPADVSLPSWFPWVLNVASIVGVTIVEPTLFVGLALLYTRTSGMASTQKANETTYAASASPTSGSSSR